MRYQFWCFMISYEIDIFYNDAWIHTWRIQDLFTHYLGLYLSLQLRKTKNRKPCQILRPSHSSFPSRIHLSRHISLSIVTIFRFSWIIHYSMIPIYIYISLYSYTYAGGSYDILVAPLLHFFIDYHTSIIETVELEKHRIKALEQHNRIKAEDADELSTLTSFQKLVYKTFNIENMYLKWYVNISKLKYAHYQFTKEISLFLIHSGQSTTFMPLSFS